MTDDDLPRPLQPVFVSTQRTWWLRFFALMLLLNLIVLSLVFHAQGVGQDRSASNRRILCALVIDDALDNPEVRAVYESECGAFP